MGFLDKNKKCSICGESKNFLGMAGSVQDGDVCSDCAKKFSPHFKLDKKMTLDTVKAHLQYREENENNFSSFSATDKVGNYILVDKNMKKFYIPSAAGLGRTPDLFDFSQLIDYELNEDGETLTQKKVALGKAAIGTLLMPGVGTIIGGVSGKSKSKSTCTNMSIRISINSDLISQAEIQLVTKETKKSGFTYKGAKDNANKIISLLDVIGKISENDTVTPVVIKESAPQSVADELSKMKGLLDSGVITQDDFDKFKQKLLGM